MATSQIQLTRSGTQNAQPSASDLAQGELALNYFDGKLFFKNNNNQIEQLNSTFRNSGGKIYVNEADNYIGLNTTSPAFLLDLGGTSPHNDNEIRINQESGTAIRIGASASATTGIIRIDSGNGSSDDSTHGFSIDYNGGGAGDLNDALIISPDNGSGTAIQAFTLQQNGTIGMSKGTSFTPFSGVTLDVEDDIQVTGTNPTFRLHKTNGTDTHDQSWIAMGTNTTDNALEFQTRESDGTFKSNDYRIIKNASGALNHQWSVANDEKLRLDSSGLGIGLSPQRTLDVGGTGAIIRGNLYIGDPTDTQATSNMILFGTRDVNEVDTLGMYANDKIVFRVGSNNQASEILILNQLNDTVTAPNLDETSINAGGNKSLVTKEHVVSRIETAKTEDISTPTYTGNQNFTDSDGGRVSVSAGMAIQHQMGHFNVARQFTHVSTNGTTPTYIDVLDVKITPRDANSKFKIEAMLNYENDGASENLVWKLFRKIGSGSFTEIGGSVDSANPANMRGMATTQYDNDENSTMSNIKLLFIDSPNTTSELTYALGYVTNTGTKLMLNRVVTSTSNGSYEYGSSSHIVTELAGI